MTFVKQPANSASPSKQAADTIKNSASPSKQAADTIKANIGAADLAIPCKVFQNSADQKEVSARLRQLPAGVRFDDQIGEPIYFDAARKMLLYRGFMCQASYNYLHKLSLDPEFEAAIDHIYMASSSALQEGGGRWRWLVLPIVFLGIIATALTFWLRH